MEHMGKMFFILLKAFETGLSNLLCIHRQKIYAVLPGKWNFAVLALLEQTMAVLGGWKKGVQCGILQHA
jgi:hypothetical protein